MAQAKANGIDIVYETHGKRTDPAILLVHGLGAQLTLWPEALCNDLAARGFFVVRYDNRDIGLSSKFEHKGIPDIGALTQKLMAGEKIEGPYLLTDMAADGIGLLDVLGIERAHVVGVSMGGMIVQTMAALHGQRVRSMTSVMSTSGRRGLPQGKPEALQMLVAKPASEEREALIAYGMKLRRTIGSPAYPVPEPELRALVAANLDRSWYPQGSVRHYAAVMASGDRVGLLPSIKVPTLVLHGAEDPLLPAACGEDVAKLVPGARLKIVPGWGHDLPTPLMPMMAAEIAGLAQGH
jgi:pimeloyl-ACP methyl ester carboxylesterase